MVIITQTQPGGIYATVNTKVLSFELASGGGFAGAMYHCAKAGGIAHHSIAHHAIPMIASYPIGANAPFMNRRNMGGGMWDTFKNILGKVVSGATVAHNAGVTTAIGNLANHIVGPKSAPVPVAPGTTVHGDTSSGLQQPGQKRPRWAGGRF